MSNFDLATKYAHWSRTAQTDAPSTGGRPDRLDDEDVRIALGLGGMPFLMSLLHVEEPLPAGIRSRVLTIFTDHFGSTSDVSPEEHAACCPWLLEPNPPRSVAELRTAVLVYCSTEKDLPDLIRLAMRTEDWATALHGLSRLEMHLNQSAPPGLFGMKALCLHHLGQYDAANVAVQRGLGSHAHTIEPAPIFSEQAYLDRWGHWEVPVISILCPTFNHERYLEYALRGFLSQDTEYPFEILIHDDASTDRTQHIIRDWTVRYPRLIRPILQTENQYSRGRRGFDILLAEARGRYIACCEGDDYWIRPDKLQHQIDTLEANPSVVCAGHNYYLFNESEPSVRVWEASRNDVIVPPRQLMNVGRLFWLPSLVFRKTFTALPPERFEAPLGDQFLTSFLGTLGPGVYFESFIGAVRRENPFSTWTPLSELEKERRRVRTWLTLVRFHAVRGNETAVEDLVGRVLRSRLEEGEREQLIADALAQLP